MGTSQTPTYDLTTKGAWIGKFGATLGYEVNGAATYSSWPPGWTVATDGSVYNKSNTETDVTNYLQPIPPGTDYACACVYRDGTLSWTITPPDDSTPYRFSLYDCYLEASADQHRTYSIQVLDHATSAVLQSLPAQEWAFQYISFVCTGTVRVVLTGGQPVMTGWFLDSVAVDPSVDGTGGVEVGGVSGYASSTSIDVAGGVALGGVSSYATTSPTLVDGVGGVAVGGTSPYASSTSVAAVGGVTLGGVSAYATASPATAVALGGVTIGGVSGYSTSTSLVGSGGVTSGGVSDYSQPPAPGSVVAAGGVAIGGVATYTSSTSIIAVGGVTVGEAEPEPILPPCSSTALAAAMRDALDATGAFDAVWQAGDSDDRGEPTRLSAIAVERGPVVSEALCDDGPDSLVIHTARHSLRIYVRRDDPLDRDDEADRLQAVATNALNGRKWFRNDWPDWARCLEWKRLPAVDSERQVLATFQARWHEEGWRVAPDS